MTGARRVAGPGWIAERFVSAPQAHTRQEAVAVPSSDPARAGAFAEGLGVARNFGGRDMLADPGVDVVYGSTVHTRHLPDAMAAIGAGSTCASRSRWR